MKTLHQSITFYRINNLKFLTIRFHIFITLAMHDKFCLLCII